MKKLLLIALILYAGNATASSLPDCPSDQSERYHNCFGTHTYASGSKYVGEFKDNKINGQGSLTYVNGGKYVGEWRDSKRNGQGTYTYANGDTYIGEWKDNEQHGKGTYTYAIGAKYVGAWKDDKMHGQGTYTYEDGTTERGYHMNNEYVPTICENMGLTKGTGSFGNCVVELIKQINEGE